ncbi:hypothetical protein BpHYR1_045397 [Brachionus plicatilis]|uniref:Uncharacterized protein n=1 Tax=Brachionus plicatilis TaxID=10195 RepID=A0A3M7SLE8_BRAPC|nr:hypothetical protein BpHYR1_045397 [Brachionus plicatilis]
MLHGLNKLLVINFVWFVSKRKDTLSVLIDCYLYSDVINFIGADMKLGSNTDDFLKENNTKIIFETKNQVWGGYFVSISKSIKIILNFTLMMRKDKEC